jgi:UDP-glucose-4-epimerase GalE
MMTRNILVTGGAGFIGSHTCKALAAAGFRPVTLDNLVYGHAWAVKWGPFVRGDLADSRKLVETIRSHDIAGVVHFAAYAYVGESVEEPGKYFRNNIVNTLNLLDAMRECEIEPIVFSSTCATYGLPPEIPISEHCPQAPVNPYGESKLFVEKALRWYGTAYGIRSMALRYFNAAGADRDGEIGEAHDPETHLIPLAIKAALGEKSHVDIYGTDYATPDGTAIRDYIHVADLADAHVLALSALLGGAPGKALNLGTGSGQSVYEIIRAVEKFSGREVPTREAPRRAGDPPQLIANADKAKTMLNWQPRASDLDTIVGSAWRWHAKYSHQMLDAASKDTISL